MIRLLEIIIAAAIGVAVLALLDTWLDVRNLTPDIQGWVGIICGVCGLTIAWSISWAAGWRRA